MRVSLLQTDIIWENKQQNLQHLRQTLEQLRGQTDLAILPEMFTTGFTMKSHELAEPVDGETISTLRTLAAQFNIALTGSCIVSHQGHYFNRAFFIPPNGDEFYYDKKHLFRMGDEPNHFSPGHHKPIIPYLGWNICLLICYDLRFPVWSRNINNQYDLLIYVANWPASRRHVWDTLLPARAIENMAYVCGVNRVGTDGNGILYNGGSTILSPKGIAIATATDNVENITTTTLNIDELNSFRQKFPVWKDADHFRILP